MEGPVDFAGVWDFDDPAGTEARLRERLAGFELTSDEAMETRTQVARALGLQGKFREGHAELDTVEREFDGRMADTLSTADPKLGATTPQDEAPVPVRVLLERGRLLNSEGHVLHARSYFVKAYELARGMGFDSLTADAAHMIAVTFSAAKRFDQSWSWNQRALEAVRGSDDPAARRWVASLANNMGWDLHEQGDFRAALAQFELAVRERLAQAAEGADVPRVQRTRAKQLARARWCVARCLRSLGRHRDAVAILQDLEREQDASGEPPDAATADELRACLDALRRADEATSRDGDHAAVPDAGAERA